MATITDSDTSVQQVKMIMRRFEDTFPGWMIVVPIIAAALLFLMVMMQRSSHAHQSFLGRLASVFDPPWAFIILAIGCGAFAFLGYQVVSLASWWLILVPVLGVGLAYVGIMYFRDSKSVGAIWASWLALLRTAVYLILAFVFLLPALQDSTKTERRSRIVLLFDVSASMAEYDDVAEDGNLKKLRTRQQKVLEFLTDQKIAFIDGLLKTNPVTVYRFGKTVDPAPKEFANTADKQWTIGELRAALTDWLIIDPKRKGIDVKQAKLENDLYIGTNLGGAVRQVFEKQSGNMLQGIVIFSDGQSNQEDDMQGSMAGEQVYEDLREPAKRAKIPLMCVGVGKFKPPISIRINDIEAPTTASPEEPWPVNVPVVAQGLKDKDYEVNLVLSRIRDGEDRPVTSETPIPMSQKSKHKEGDPDRVEFQIDMLALKNTDLVKVKAMPVGERKKLMAGIEGTWEIQARVARDKREAFGKAFHTPEQPARVKIYQKKLRVLLFAGGPSKEYQFLRTLLFREVEGNRMEMGVLLQTNKEEEIDLDEKKPQEWVLDHFPIHRVRPSPKEKPYTLFEYDVIIALDPDWSALQEDELKLVKEWCQERAGGLIMVAGPVNTYQLRALGGNAEADPLTPIRDLCPMVMEDSRLLGLGEGYDPAVKFPLKFDGPLSQYDFMKLDEDGKGPIAGWMEFFYANPDPKPNDDLENGFYTYYPVKNPKSIAQVLAWFPGRKPEPWIAAAKSGSGNVVYIGALEICNLRAYKAKYHQHFWVKLCRYAGSGNMGRVQKFGEMNIPDKYLTGEKRRAEYRLRGPDGTLLGREDADKYKLQIVVMPFKKAEDAEPDPDVTTWNIYPLKAKPGAKNEKSGWFMGEIPLELPGKFQLRLAHANRYFPKNIKLEEKNELKMKIPGTEEELIKTVLVTQPNPEMDNVKPDLVRLYNLASDNDMVLPRVPEPVKKDLRAVKGPLEEGAPTKPRDGRRLYFDLASAKLIPDLMIQAKEEKEIKGNTRDIRDWALDLGFDAFDEAAKLASVMGIVVLLLSIEWLSRKLLRLA